MFIGLSSLLIPPFAQAEPERGTHLQECWTGHSGRQLDKSPVVSDNSRTFCDDTPSRTSPLPSRRRGLVRNTAACASSILLLCLVGCSGSGSRVEAHEKYKIWVVGHGDPYNALRTGAEKAWAHVSSEQPELKETVELKSADDHHLPEQALELARRIRNDPSTLAVIGHDQSNTTFAAEPIYADAGIPVVFAAATSPKVGGRYPYRGVVFRASATVRAVNFVRLPPSDAPYQSHALRVTALKIAEKMNRHSKSARIYVVRETSRNAEVYSGPIGDGLEKDDRFSKLVVGERKFDRDQLDVYTLVTSIRGARANVVVFIGYPESALDLLQEMKERIRQDKSSEIPIFVFPDACLTKEVADSSFPFEVYVTSSSLPLDACEPTNEEFQKLRQGLEPFGRPLTSEVYAFDAVVLLSAAIEHCGGNLGRRCVMGYIREQRHVDSICRPYHLDDGEAANGLYLLYVSRHVRGKANGYFVEQGFIGADHEGLLMERELP